MTEESLHISRVRQERIKLNNLDYLTFAETLRLEELNREWDRICGAEQ